MIGMLIAQNNSNKDLFITKTPILYNNRITIDTTIPSTYNGYQYKTCVITYWYYIL